MVKWHLQVENPLASINDERESLSKSGAKFHPSFLIKSMLCLFARRRQISRPLDIEVNSCEANGQTHESWMNVFIPRWIQRGAILAIFSDASNFLWFIRTLADKHRVVFPEVIWRLHHSLAEQAFLEHTWGASSDELLLAFWFAGFEWLVHKWYTTFLFFELESKTGFPILCYQWFETTWDFFRRSWAVRAPVGKLRALFQKRADHFGFKLPGFNFTQDFNKIYQDHTGRSSKPRTFM